MFEIGASDGTADTIANLNAVETGRSQPYQAISKLGPIWEVLPQLLPARPYCADNPRDGIRILPQNLALRRAHIQLNHPAWYRFLVFDVDRPDGALAFEDANLPGPNWVCQSPANGHAHLIYTLSSPVTMTDAGRENPRKFLANLQHGMTVRLDADRAYRGLISKNPFSPRWRTRWLAPFPYSMGELAESLAPSDMRRPTESDAVFGIGRNCSLFDSLRRTAYRAARAPRDRYGSLAAFQRYLSAIAWLENQEFATPLRPREVNAIAKSVARWTWRRFSPEQFSAIQSHRRSSLKVRRLRAIMELDP